MPYRRSKLTLLMKDVFDISCKRLCSTVVLAHVSPLASDVKHSTSTLQYAAPLRVAARKKPAGKKYEKDTRDPALWTHAQVPDRRLDICPFHTSILTRILSLFHAFHTFPTPFDSLLESAPYHSFLSIPFQ